MVTSAACHFEAKSEVLIDAFVVEVTAFQKVVGMVRLSNHGFVCSLIVFFSCSVL